MTSKQFGNIGEAKVLSKCVEYGIPVYIPFGDNEKADLIIDYKGQLLKLQVKTSIKVQNGKMTFDLTSSTLHRKHGIKYKYSNTDIDYFALYNVERDVILLYKVPESPISAITFRYLPAKNSQEKNINYEQDYLFEKVLCVETLHGKPKC